MDLILVGSFWFGIVGMDVEGERGWVGRILEFSYEERE